MKNQPQKRRIFVPGKSPNRGKILNELTKQFPQYYQCEIDEASLVNKDNWEAAEFDGVDGHWITFEFTVSERPVQMVAINDSVRPRDRAGHVATRPINSKKKQEE
jgi:hypothetical protein